LDRRRELNAHSDVDRPDASVQVLDTEWVFDLKVCPQTRMIDRFKARIVADGQPQILGFDCHDVHAPMVPICEIKMLLAIAAAKDMELFHLDTTTAFISAELKPEEVIHCDPPRDIDIGLGSDGSPRGWKLHAPLEGTRPAAMCWHQSSTEPITSFGLCQLVLVALYGCVIVRLKIRCCSARMSTSFSYHLLAHHWLTPLFCSFGPDLRAR
jgi:hypothetical protein